MNDSPLNPSSPAIDDISEQVILWSHARQQRTLTTDVALAAGAFAIVAFGFVLQALYFQHWVFAGVLGASIAGAAWLFLRFRAQARKCHQTVTAYQADLGELLWQKFKETDSDQTCHLIKSGVLAELAKPSAGQPTDERVSLRGHTGELATVDDVKLIQAAVEDLEVAARHELHVSFHFKIVSLLAVLALTWGLYGVLMGVLLNALVLAAGWTAAKNASGIKQDRPRLMHGTKEDHIEFLGRFALRTRYDVYRSHLELITGQGKVVDPYRLKGVASEADA